VRYLLLLISIVIYFTDSVSSSVRVKDVDGESRVALVIGNSLYSGALPKLTNPIRDARDMRDVLKSRGFKVIYGENIDKREMKRLLERLYESIGKGGVGLIYFSGHGLEVDGENYIIPIGADIKEKSDTEFEAIALNQILKRLDALNSRFNIVILDACRNDPFSRAIGVGGLAKIEPPIGLFVAYSTGAGGVASDGRVGENGLFTKYLIENIKRPLDIQQVFRRTREEVYEASSNRQFPAIYDQTIRGDFYFTPPHSNSSRASKGGEADKIATIKPIEGRGGADIYEERWSKRIYNGERSYSFNSPNSVKDNLTGLIWTRGSSETMSMDRALSYCRELLLDGYSGWDLPTKRELQYLSDTGRESFPAIDTRYFNVSNSFTHYWTKSEPEYDHSKVFGINFLFGTYDNYLKSEEGYTLCVKR